MKPIERGTTIRLEPGKHLWVTDGVEGWCVLCSCIVGCKPGKPGERIEGGDSGPCTYGVRPASEAGGADKCRRCSECAGEDHHWLETMAFECKHCTVVVPACDDCMSAPGTSETPDGFHLCDGCKATADKQGGESLTPKAT